MNNPRILWESRNPVVGESFRDGRIAVAANGGNAYDIQAAWQLASRFPVEVSSSSLKRPGEGILGYWARMQRVQEEAEVVVREPYPIVFGRFNKGVRYIGMIHHIDDVISRKSVWHRWYFSRLKKRLTALDLVVTVSDYWARYLQRMGCRQVRVIYNAFDPSDFKVSDAELAEFRKRHQIPNDKPVVYIGNASRQKGVYEVYQALKDQGYHLVMSGPKNQASDLPVQYLCLDRHAFIRLLHSCHVVLCMSRMVEGWNRIAHEAMLCRVPVIGNGSGGMLELLQGGGQAVVTDPSELPDAVRHALTHRDSLAESGYAFASRFDMDYFRQQWHQAVESVIAR